VARPENLEGTAVNSRSRDTKTAPGGTRAVVYARVSSVEQEKEGYSIPSQLKLLRDYALAEGFTVVREYTDAETAKNSGRTSFNEMLGFLKRSSCRVILVEKTDRLYRNLKDYATLDGLDLEIHLVKEGVILSPDSRSHEKFMHGIKVLMAKNYIDNLSEEVKKGMTEKAEQGHWPSWAPIGYLNNPKTHHIEPHPDEAPLIRHLFEDAADCRITLETLAKQAHERGLRSRRAQSRISMEGVRRILRNPIYWGPFLWKGKLYDGKHEPLISHALFDEVQRARAMKGKPRRRIHDFAFTGLVFCKCGRRLVGQIAKRRYIYYQCSARCGVRQLKEAELSDLFLGHVEAIRIDRETAEWILEAIKKFEAQRRQERQEELEKCQRQQRKIQNTLDKAYDDKLAGRIDQELWDRRFSGWQEELAAVRAQIRDLEGATFHSFERADALLKLCRSAPALYSKQSPDQQSRLIKLICSNSTWDGVTLTPTYKKPFDSLAEGLLFVTGGADEIRTRDLRRDRPAF
jgi:site-specific DNA recombinase